MTGRGIDVGDVLYVARLAPENFSFGQIVIVDLGDEGAVCAELHGDGRRLWARSSTGRPARWEMEVEIEASQVLGRVAAAGPRACLHG